MTAAEALAAAEQEGLTLLRALNESGFLGVYRGSAHLPWSNATPFQCKPIRAQVDGGAATDESVGRLMQADQAACGKWRHRWVAHVMDDDGIVGIGAATQLCAKALQVHKEVVGSERHRCG